jgi:alanine dehydrogenase
VHEESPVIIGVPREIKDNENRVSLVPTGAETLVAAGHRVLVETGAGIGSSFTDAEYSAAGATLIDSAEQVWADADMVMKVKEPIAPEYGYFRPNLVVYTYLHLAPERELTQALLDSEVTAIAYETIEDERGDLPLLRPMSEVAGRMAVQVGARYLERPNGGRGVLLSGVPGVRPGRVTILGGGVVGLAAARMARGLGAHVLLLDIKQDALYRVEEIFDAQVHTEFSNPGNVRQAVAESDLVVGAVLVKGAQAPTIVTRDMLGDMAEGSVIVDVSVDQGGCVETTKVTTHSDPTYVVDGVVHYGVANMPGAVPRTSTLALTSVTLPHALRIAKRGAEEALRSDPLLLPGLNTYKGKLTYEAVGAAQGLDSVDAASLL